jgi:hypothetical protein
MPARIRKIRHDEETRNKIKTSQLVNRLTEHVLGNVELGATQVSAALGLLRKTLPDLTTTTLQGDADNPLNIVHQIERRIVSQTEDEIQNSSDPDAPRLLTAIK